MADGVTDLSCAMLLCYCQACLFWPSCESVVCFYLRALVGRLVRREKRARRELLAPQVAADPLEMMVLRVTLYVCCNETHTDTHAHSCDWCIIRAVSAPHHSVIFLSRAVGCQSCCWRDVKYMSRSPSSQCLDLSAGSRRLPRRPRSPWWAWCCCKCSIHHSTKSFMFRIWYFWINMHHNKCECE